MSLLLHIDTSGEIGSVALSENENLISFKACSGQQQQAGFLQPAIKDILDENGKVISDLAAVAVTIGPGSYTGLRVGLASAKGICYACGIPLITLTTTYVMAVAGRKELQNSYPDYGSFSLCPMIDARRMEVFLALYDEHLKEIHPPAAFILDDPSMISFKDDKPVFCFGNGADKYRDVNQSDLVIFGAVSWDARSMIEEVNRKYKNQEFDSIEKTTPLYVKPFYTPAKK